MHYKISYTLPSAHFIDIECTITNIVNETLELQLPSWRPGRYEIANFAKNIQQWKVFDQNNNALSYQKLTKDKWLVNTKGASSITVKYNYFAAELNAGSSLLDENQLYINPVNCLVYAPVKLDEPCHLEIEVPSNYKLAGDVNVLETTVVKDKIIYKSIFNNYHHVVDTPFICSNTLQHTLFVLDGVEFNIWFQGECKPDWAKIVGDFFIFINEQFVLFKKFPVERYHFLIQVLPFPFYHGVEHDSSTVIAIGPSYQLMRKELYNELLGVSSHELFHTWNVKNIRPKEMMPYQYNTENYAQTGYVYEGVTTYYGDLMLFRSGVFNDEEYFRTLNTQIQKHLDNPGRFNQSVSQSSFDTWLDGYVPGVPGRKVSIYTEGCLLAFMADVLIREQTKNEKSLDDVMRMLYTDFGQRAIGYTKNDYQTIIENITGNNWNSFFNNLVEGTKDYTETLKKCINYLGFELSVVSSRRPFESFLGFKAIEQNNETLVTAIYPNSNAERAGLMLKDKVIAINGFEIKNNLTDWCNYLWPKAINLTVVSEGVIRNVTIEPSNIMYYKTYQLIKIDTASPQQAINYTAWSGRKF